MEISQNEIDNLKPYLCNRVAPARYYANGVWTEINIDKINILPDGRIAIYILFDSSTPEHIDRIEFYNQQNEIFAAGNETIDKEASAGDVLYRYIISFSQTVK